MPNAQLRAGFTGMFSLMPPHKQNPDLQGFSGNSNTQTWGLLKRTSCWEDALFITCTLSMCCQGFICDYIGLNKQECSVEQESWQEEWFKMNHPFSSHLRAVWRQSLGNWITDSTSRDPRQQQEKLWPSSQPGNSKTKKYRQGLTGGAVALVLDGLDLNTSDLSETEREGFRWDGSVQAVSWFKSTVWALLLLQNVENDSLLGFACTSAVHHWAAPLLHAHSDLVHVAEHPQGCRHGMKQPWKMCSRGVQRAPSTNEHSANTIRLEPSMSKIP